MIPYTPKHESVKIVKFIGRAPIIKAIAISLIMRATTIPVKVGTYCSSSSHAIKVSGSYDLCSNSNHDSHGNGTHDSGDSHHRNSSSPMAVVTMIVVVTVITGALMMKLMAHILVEIVNRVDPVMTMNTVKVEVASITTVQISAMKAMAFMIGKETVNTTVTWGTTALELTGTGAGAETNYIFTMKGTIYITDPLQPMQLDMP